MTAFTDKQEAVQQVQTMLWTNYGINVSTEQATKLVDIGIRVAEARAKTKPMSEHFDDEEARLSADAKKGA